MTYDHPSQIMDEIAAVTPTFAGVSFERLDKVGSIQWPCNDEAPEGTPIMHVDEFDRGKGRFVSTPFVPTDERSTRRFPLVLTTGRILSQYNVGAQTRRTATSPGIPRTSWRCIRTTPRCAGITDGDVVTLASRVGETTLRAQISDRMPTGRRVHDLPLPGDRRERRDHGELRLGDELPGVQGDGRPGRTGAPDLAGAGRVGGRARTGRRTGGVTCRSTMLPRSG